MNVLNIFEKAVRKQDSHEDVLTYNFLSLLGYSKYLQIQFIEYLREAMLNTDVDASDIPDSLLKGANSIESIQTQISTGEVTKYEKRLISILITDDAVHIGAQFSESSRRGILDGLIVMQERFMFAIENKPASRNVWVDQLSFKIKEDMEIESHIIVLSWRRIIESLNIILQNHLAGIIEKRLIEDFLRYINSFYPELNPFTSFKVCNDLEYLISRRCCQIMECLSMGEVTPHKGWQESIKVDRKEIKEITLHYTEEGDGWKIILELFPGDIMSQARNLYPRLDTTKIMELPTKGWTVRSSFHVSYRSSGLYWCHPTISVTDYIGYWKDKILNNQLQQVDRVNWAAYFNQLLDDGIIDNDDMKALRENVFSKAYQTLNVCPGLGLFFSWSSSEAESLDVGNRFTEVVRNRISEALYCWE